MDAMNVQGGGSSSSSGIGGSGSGGANAADRGQQAAPPNAQQLMAQMQMMMAQQQQQQQSGATAQVSGTPNSGSQNPAAPVNVPPRLQQNPTQMMQVIQAQIANLQRQWQTVQAQPDGQQKTESSQHLAAQMKRMNVFQAQTLQALQRQQQDSQSQSGSSQQAQSPMPQGSQQQQQSQPQQQQVGQQGQSSQQSGAAQSGEAQGPAHNAQLAALQAFAQQQRNQALHPSSTPLNQGQPSSIQQTATRQPSMPMQQPKGDLLGALRAFMAQRGQPLPANMPTVFVGPSSGTNASGGTINETQSVDMQTLFATVIQFGGSARIAAQSNGWAIVAQKLGLAAAPPSTTVQAEVDSNGVPYPAFVPSKLAQFFRERFSSFEEFWLARMRSQANNGQGPPSWPSQQQQQSDQSQGNAMQQHAIPAQGDSQTQAAQESARKAQEMQAQLPQQLQQLQEMIKGGKLTQDQAKERYLYLQNAAKMAILRAQAQAQAVAGAPSGPPMQLQPNNQPMNASSIPEPSSSATHSNGAEEVKKPAKRGRKPTASKMNNNAAAAPEADAQDVKPTVTAASPAHPSFAGAQNTMNGAPMPVNITQINLHAQQAMRLLHQGIENPAQQVNAFAAVRIAQSHAQGLQNVDVTAPSQFLARVYNQVLTQAQSSGQLISVAAPIAFTTAQQELDKQQQQQQGNVAAMANGAGNSQAIQQAARAIPTASAQGSEKPNAPPAKYKVEYMPIRRDVRTYGGWDLDALEAQLGPLLTGKGRLPRSVRELGSVDIEGLTMSLRSRIEVEVTYALNTLLILTASIQAPGFHLLLSLCEDLCDELLELLVENAFDEQDFTPIEEMQVIAMPHSPLTHAEWISGVLEDEEEMKIRMRKRMQRYEQEENLAGEEYYAALAADRSTQRKADVALTVVEILRNVAIIPDNHVFLNSQPGFLNTLMTIISAIEHAEINRKGQEGNSDQSFPDTVFTSSEALYFRKEVLSIVASLAGESCLLSILDPVTVASIFTFLISFVLDAAEIEREHGTVFREMPINPPQQPTPQNPHPPPPMMSMQPFSRKVPQHADLALEAFSSLAQPDANRQTLGNVVDERKLVTFGETLIRLLPVSDLDFHMLKTEARLGFCERVAMSLFDVAYSGSAGVKRQLRQLPGTKGIMFRCIKRLMKIHADFSHNPFSVLTRRLVETMRILSDGENLFDRPPLLGFGMESYAGGRSSRSVLGGSSNHGEAGRDDEIVRRHSTKDRNMLIDEEAAVVDLMTQEGIDPTIISEFEKML